MALPASPLTYTICHLSMCRYWYWQKRCHKRCDCVKRDVIVQIDQRCLSVGSGTGTSIHTHTHTHTHTHVYIYTHKHTHIRTYTHTYIHTYIYTYIHISGPRTYTHICKGNTYVRGQRTRHFWGPSVFSRSLRRIICSRSLREEWGGVVMIVRGDGTGGGV